MTKKELKSQLNHARPRLKVLSPLVYRVCQAFIAMNVMIAVLFMFINTNLKHVPNPVVNGIIGFRAWAVIYFFLGVSILYGLIKNSYKHTRRTLIAGLFVQMIWTIALVLLVFQGYTLFATMMLWLLLAWVKAWTIVHFIPVISWDGTGGESNDKR